MKIHIDFETRSFCDLKKCGAWVYSEHETTDIICMAYKIDDGEVKLWLPGAPLPEEFFNDDVVYIARNALFEHAIVSNVAIRKYGFPERMRDVKNWVCTAAMSRRVGMPGSLNDCALALHVEQKKMTVGASLINKYSVPVRPKTGKPYFRELVGEDRQAMFDYCIADVLADSQCYAILEKLPENNLQLERDTFYLDFAQNVQGLPVDVPNLKRVIKILHDAQKNAALLAEKTSVNVKSPSQIIVACAKRGIRIDNARKKTLDDLLAVPELPDDIREILELRAFLGKASVKKFDAMVMRMSPDNRIRHAIQYFGAHTGRFSSKGVQFHNLPKMEIKAEEVDGLVEGFQFSGGYVKLIDDAKKILPAMIQAPKGQTFIMGDFSAIEARGLAFIAGEKWRLDVFRTHGKIYEASASAMFNVPIEAVTKESVYRKRGKTAELALGYQGAVGALVKFGADSFMSGDEMAAMVRKWREANKRIVKLWYDTQAAFGAAFRTKREIKVNEYISYTGYKKYVKCNLPSGRAIYYHDVKLDGDNYSYYNHQKKDRVSVYGGILVENFTQAVCRDLLNCCMIEMAKEGLNPLLHVHDEIVCLENVKGIEKKCAIFERISNTPPDWFKGFPLKTDYEISGRYHK